MDELSKLQDAMPADSLEAVEKLLTKELGRGWREHIELDPGPVLGSATIAQAELGDPCGPFLEGKCVALRFSEPKRISVLLL